ncbi:MAG: MFS transporter [Gammaproteobacteria bacterium]
MVARNDELETLGAATGAKTTGARLGVATYFGYGLGSVATGIFTTLPGLLLLAFMVRHLAMPPALAGLVIFLPRFWDVFVDPVMGAISDRTRSRIGARRPWLALGGLLLPLSFVFLFRVPELSGQEAALYVLLVYVIGNTAFSIFQVPYVALPAEMTEDYDERTTIMAWRITLLAVGILIAGGAAPEIVRLAGGGREGYATMAIVIGAIMLAACASAFFGTRRIPLVQPVRTTAPFAEQLRAAAQNKPFFWLLGAFLVQALGTGCMLAAVDFFSVYRLNDPALTSRLFACLIAPSLVTMPLWAWVGHRFGKKTGFIACTLIFALGGLSLISASPDRVWLVYLQVLIMGTAYAGTQMFPLAMLPDTISADTARTGLRRAGSFTGVWTAGEKLGMALGPAVFAGMLAASGFVEGQDGAVLGQPPQALAGILIGTAVAPALFLLASLYFIHRYGLESYGRRPRSAPPGITGAPP